MAESNGSWANEDSDTNSVSCDFVLELVIANIFIVHGKNWVI